jgi:hypothetical protein
MVSPCWALVEVQIVEAQLSDLSSSTSNKSDKSAPQKQTSTLKEVACSEMMIEKCYKW